MTLEDARSTLTSGPLKFGDDAQIKAHRYMADVEEIIAIMAEKKITSPLCSDCGGDGLHNCDCDYCTQTCDKCDGDGLTGRAAKHLGKYDNDQIGEAVKELTRRKGETKPAPKQQGMAVTAAIA